MKGWMGMIAFGCAVLAFAGCEKKDADGGKSEEQNAPKAPKFEPAKAEKKTFASIGLTVDVPTNLKVSESDGKVTVSADGFPTVTFAKKAEKNNGIGTRLRTSGDEINGKFTTSSTTYSCYCEDSGDFKSVVKDMCSSMKPVENPRVLPAECDEAVGVEKAVVVQVVAAQSKTTEACLKDAIEKKASFAGSTWGFSFTRKDAKNSSSHSSGNVGLMRCLRPVYEALREHPALTVESDYKLSCTVEFARY